MADEKLHAEAAEYFETNLKATLTRGLHALCTEKPTDPVAWLGEWLQANKPPPAAVAVPEPEPEPVLDRRPTLPVRSAEDIARISDARKFRDPLDEAVEVEAQ